jgi:hypothetical protein
MVLRRASGIDVALGIAARNDSSSVALGRGVPQLD